jgi:hypothetical protein
MLHMTTADAVDFVRSIIFLTEMDYASDEPRLLSNLLLPLLSKKSFLRCKMSVKSDIMQVCLQINAPFQSSE